MFRDADLTGVDDVWRLAVPSHEVGGRRVGLM
jgi:hypothetical protein